jgi:branched-subunit amino acid aminotransferase/4-amino-4-deoxychorismate lyase
MAIRYDGASWRGAVARRGTLPAPAQHAQRLRDSFDELHRACSS